MQCGIEKIFRQMSSYKTTFIFTEILGNRKHVLSCSTWMRKLSSKMKSFVHTCTKKKKNCRKSISEAYFTVEQLKLHFLFLEKCSLSQNIFHLFRKYIQVLISSPAFQKFILNFSQIHCFNYAKLTCLINPLYSPLLKVFNSRILIEPGPKCKWYHLYHHIHSSSIAIRLVVQSAR